MRDTKTRAPAHPSTESPPPATRHVGSRVTDTWVSGGPAAHLIPAAAPLAAGPPIENARPEEVLRAQQVRRAQASRERAAAQCWAVAGMAACLICLAGIGLLPSFWLIWGAGCLMGATAVLLGRATRREAHAAIRAADQAIAQLHHALPPSQPALTESAQTLSRQAPADSP